MAWRPALNGVHDNKPTSAAPRRDKQPQPHTGDSYRAPLRVQSGTGCRECGAVYDNGRWMWCATTRRTSQLVCPACRRILEHAPAAELWLQGGGYLDAHRDEVLALLHHQEQGERERHALERLMRIDEQAGGMRVTTTGTHLLRRIGAALLRTHHGRLSIEYRDGDGLLRARWSHADSDV
jgi:hypothetical protein